jgi:outer membrane protein assembly factor BamA
VAPPLRLLSWCAGLLVGCAPSALVRFSGNSVLSDVELREVMCSGKPVSGACPEQGTTSSRFGRLATRDRMAIQRLYDERGYIADVTVPPLQTSEGEAPKPIVVQVVEGPLYMFGSIRAIEVRPEPVEVDLASVAGVLPASFAPGARFAKRDFLAWTRALKAREGAPEAEWTAELYADRETRRVDILLKIKRR